jgi:4-amino-4-deoxy-L-arabinose transferase-like glycosyltransferase
LSSLLPNRIGRHKAITLILLAFVLLGLAYSVVNPLHEATDELRHYRFVRYIAVNRSLPVQGVEPCRSQSHHPPLFYLLSALATAAINTGRDLCYVPPQNPFWAYRDWEVGTDNKNQFLHGPDEAFPWRGEALAVHIVRAINVLIGAGVVWLTWASGRTLWPDQPAMAIGAAAIVAFNPMFLYMSGAINNDVIAAFSGAAVTLACLRLLRAPAGLIGPSFLWRNEGPGGVGWGLIFGVLYTLALMSKFNLAAVIVLIEAAITWVAWRRGQWRLGWQVNFVMGLVTILLAGWWFVRNQLLYGEPTGFRIVTELWGVRDPNESWGLAFSELPYVWSSLWGRFGFGQIPLPQAIYNGLFWLALIGLLGLPIGVFITRRHGEKEKEGEGRELVGLVFLLLNVALIFAVLFSYMLVSPAGPMGRFFFPGLPAFALLIFWGFKNWVDFGFWILDFGLQSKIQNPKSKIAWLAGLVNVGMVGLALVILFGYLRPAYARPAGLPADAAIPNPVNARFDSLVTLLGYEMSPAAIRPGEPLDVTLYWEVTGQPPGDYLLFVHLVDEVGTMVAQRDTHPGLGNFPTSQWRPGNRFVETIRVYTPETAYAPETVTVQVGLYAPGAYRLAVSSEDGKPLGDSLSLGVVTLAEKDSPYPNAQDQNFNNEVRLVGYEYDRRQVWPGESLRVTLYWEALQEVTADYVVEVRLVDEAGNVVATADSDPQMGQSPTNRWTAGQQVTDEHILAIDPATAAGSYRVDMALLDTSTNRRQNIVAPDGHWIDNHLWLARVLIR